MMRAKLKVTKIELFESCENITMSAVCRSNGYPGDGSDEDNTYAKFTPTASLTMTINNPALLGKIKPGQKFYVDFIECAE